jgi:hypothetical protein
MCIKHNQSGFSLLILLLALMGLGGFALANYSKDLYKQVEKSRYEHNKDVLKKAKNALLMYAYRYPQFNKEGPGRLPCPDTVGLDGVGDTSCNIVGRFPWNHSNMNFYEVKDFSGEHLWYAVSNRFFNSGGGPIINSDKVGSISIFDQSGGLIYDGSATGVAAVIIAPGEVIKRDENNDGKYEYAQERGTNAEKLDPRNYLDTYYLASSKVFDNSKFTNASSAIVDGFIKGPVVDTWSNDPPPAPVIETNILAVNDQIVVITTDELIAQAEKGTLDVYKQSINAYLANTGNVYPWLFDYNVADLDTYSAAAANGTLYPDGALTNIGRIPSIFAEYFAVNDSEKFDSEVLIGVKKSFSIAAVTYTLDLSVTSSSAMIDVEFQDDGVGPNDDVIFSAKKNGGLLHTKELYFYDSTGNWLPCAPPADQISDCNMTALGVFTTGPNAFASTILIVGVSVDFSNNIDIKLGTNPAPTLAYVAPTAGFNHARVNAAFLPAAISNITELPSNVYYRIGSYPVGGSAFVESNSGSQSLLDNSDFAGPGITNQSTGNVTIGVRYYPVLPSWAKSNNWHRSIMMAIAPDYLPNGSGTNDCLTNTPCLTVSDIGGIKNDKGYLLTIAGSVAALVDDDSPQDGFTDDLQKIFDPENADLDTVFLRRQGDDTVLVVQ